VRFLYPIGLYLTSLSGVIILLALLRTRIRRREVASLFLWEGLPGERGGQTARIRLLIDLLLILQLAALLALVIAIAQPAWPVELAVDGAIAVLDRYPDAEAAVIALSDHPAILVGSDRPRGEAMEALERSQPGWYGDAAREDLLRVLAAAGGEGAFARVILFTDCPFPDPPPFLETVAVSGGGNRGITAFTAREDPASGGVDAFVKVTNYTKTDQEATLRISDGTDSVALSVFLPSGSSEDYVIPFPSSRGTSFTATLNPGDDFPGDDVRYFGLARPIELSLRWIGPADRYLLAALAAAVPVREVGEGEPADLTVACDTDSPPVESGNVLLVHASMPGIVRLGAEGGGGEIIPLNPDHPVLSGVDPADLRVWSVPSLDFIAPGEIILTASGRPFLVEFAQEERTIWFIASELMETNLPITVDFPILIRNIVRQLVRLPAASSYGWTLVGEGIPLRKGGEPVGSIIGPDGRQIPLIEGQTAFFPAAPGEYRLVTKRGTYPVGVNVSPSESVTPSSAGEPPEDGQGRPRRGSVLYRLWPAFAGLAAILLIIEWLVYIGVNPLRRRAG